MEEMRSLIKFLVGRKCRKGNFPAPSLLPRTLKTVRWGAGHLKSLPCPGSHVRCRLSRQGPGSPEPSPCLPCPEEWPLKC